MIRSVIFLLAAAAALSDLAFSLKCYTCIDKLSRECNETKECLPSEKFCRTVAKSPDVGFPFNGEEVVTKDCTVSCQTTDTNALGTENRVNCCETDLCNNGGFRIAGSSSTEKPTSQATTKATTVITTQATTVVTTQATTVVTTRATTKSATKSATIATASNTQGVNNSASMVAAYTSLVMGVVIIRGLFQV